MTLFEGFAVEDTDTPRGVVRALVGRSGPPMLLLHGYHETRLMWHAVAPRLAERFTVVAADLPGYGDSFCPPVTDDGKTMFCAPCLTRPHKCRHTRTAFSLLTPGQARAVPARAGAGSVRCGDARRAHRAHENAESEP
jgi:pimeloyl-ACP methyl ester carboxylesterase